MKITYIDLMFNLIYKHIKLLQIDEFQDHNKILQ
jgi:hypothetical protein